ncbi:MAG: S-layer homology domain-containing protein [Clostridia bacterium]|nr:S-layer homology domain-containing protein [Clostridia bacterium]
MKTVKKHISIILAAACLAGVCPVASYADAAGDVAAALDGISISQIVDNDFSLPLSDENGVTFRWESSDKEAIYPIENTAYVLAGLDRKKATLTVTAEKDGAADTKSFDIDIEPFSFSGGYIFNDDFETGTADDSVWKLDADFMPNSADNEYGANYMGIASDIDDNHFYMIKRNDNSVNGAKKSYIHLIKDGLPNEARIIYETKIYVNQQPKNLGGGDIFLNHWWCRDMANTIGRYSGFAAAYVGGNNGIQIRATLDAAPAAAKLKNELYSWRKLTFDVQSGIGIFSCYADDEKVAADYKMRAVGASLKHLAFGFDGNTTGEVWLDDVRIYEYPKSIDVLLKDAGFGVSDTAAVSSDLVLPTPEEGTVTWISSNPEILSETGVVDRTRVEGETEEVTLYAVLNNSGLKSIKEYNFTIIAEEPKEPGELELLDIDSIVGEQSKDALEKGFSLPVSTPSGKAITWSSSNTEVLEIRNNSYAAIKPANVAKSVMITAAINVDGSEETRSFVLTVAKGKPMDNEIDIAEIAGQDLNNIINDFELPSETKSGRAVTWKSSDDECLFIHDATAYVIRKPDPKPVILIASVDNNGVVTDFPFSLTVAKSDEIENYLINEDFEGVSAGSLPENTAYSQWGKDLTVLDNNPNIEIGVKAENDANNIMDVFHKKPDGNQHSLLHINFNTPKKGSVVVEYKYRYVLTGGQGNDTNANIWINSTTGYNAASSGNFVKFPFNDAFVVAQMGSNRSQRENYDAGNWHKIKATLNLDDGVFDMYLDGRKTIENGPKIEGDGAMRIQVGFDRGSAGHCQIDDVKVYMDPVSIVRNYAESIDIGDVSNVVKDIEIPEKTPLGDADIMWVSSRPDVVSVSGKVNNPKDGNDIPVTLWALVESNNNRSIKRFDLNVARIKSDAESVDFDFENLNFNVPGLCMDDVLRLPTVGELGSTITWVSSHPDIITNEGIVSRIPYDNEKITEVILTATVSKGNAGPKSKTFTVMVPERNYALNATVTGSSGRVNKRFEFVRDNDSSTSWAPADGDKKPSLVIDLKETKLVNKIVINGKCDDVTVSYRTSSSNTYNRIGSGQSITFSPKEMKTVKLEFIGAAEVSSVGIYYSLDDCEAVKADMDALNLGNLDRVTSNIRIPAKGSVCSSTITAVSSDSRYLSNSGVVTRPEDSDKNVTLTLTLTHGNYSETKEYSVRILKKASSGGSGGGGGGSYGYKGSAAPNIITAPVKNDAPGDKKIPAMVDVFSDLSETVWAKTQIESFASRKIVNGNPDGRFEPNRKISREEFVKLVINSLGIDASEAKCGFEDVPEDSWYYSYVSKAAELGIVNGVDDKHFGVGIPILRCDMAVIIDRAFNAVSKETDDISFSDEGLIPEYALKSVKALNSLGVINGFEDGSFRPNETASRAQAVVAVYNYLQLK